MFVLKHSKNATDDMQINVLMTSSEVKRSRILAEKENSKSFGKIEAILTKIFIGIYGLLLPIF